MGGTGPALMSSTVDANILVYASNESAKEHARAKNLVDGLVAGPALTTLFWPVLLSYLRIVTHPRIFERPLPPDIAASAIDRLISAPTVQIVGEGPTFWAAYRSIDIGQADGLEFLPHVCHSRERHIQSAGDVDFDLLLDHLAALDPREGKSI